LKLDKNDFIEGGKLAAKPLVRPISDLSVEKG